jgi:hypothetical protein
MVFAPYLTLSSVRNTHCTHITAIPLQLHPIIPSSGETVPTPGITVKIVRQVRTAYSSFDAWRGHFPTGRGDTLIPLPIKLIT